MNPTGNRISTRRWTRTRCTQQLTKGNPANQDRNTVASVTAGRFYNSDRAYSNYAGVYYQPLAIGPIKLGAVFGGFNGYPQTNNGGWFAAALPALTWEGDLVGANLIIIPTIADRVHGAISLELKLKIWE